MAALREVGTIALLLQSAASHHHGRCWNDVAGCWLCWGGRGAGLHCWEPPMGSFLAGTLAGRIFFPWEALVPWELF